ncbi:TetR/AcrR family transcriptional regulator [Acidaminococcus sp.]|uniref:TetR/AcrR family transcriptional regulator n=1 Tax=Acidaminococcus sp. TaxID=1872103 RepID=UPI003D7F146D
MHRRNSEETMQRLLDAGAELFDQKGYHNVSIKEIGRLAGCNSALIAYHYGSKQALYQAIIESQLQALQQLQVRLDKEGLPPLERLKEYLHTILKSQLDPRRHMVILYQELITHSGLLTSDSWSRLARMGDYVQTLLIRAVAEGELKAPQEKDDYSYVTFILTAVTEMLFLVKDRPLLSNPEGHPSDVMLEKLINYVFRPLMP